MQYPAVHFPLATGEGGEFEEFTVRRNQEAIGYRTGNVTACAARTASQKSPITAALLAIDAQLEAVGVIVLPTFDATVQLHEAHPQCISQGSGRCKAGSEFNGFIDCRHWCSPGVALTVIERRLYAMLSPIPEPLRYKFLRIGPGFCAYGYIDGHGAGIKLPYVGAELPALCLAKCANELRCDFVSSSIHGACSMYKARECEKRHTYASYFTWQKEGSP